MKKPFKYRQQQRRPVPDKKDDEQRIAESRPHKPQPFVPEPQPKGPPKIYKVLMYTHFAMAKADKEKIVATCDGCDQLNVVIREEGNMDDPELLQLNPKVKIFAGEAWNLIHERRQQEGWYDTPH